MAECWPHTAADKSAAHRLKATAFTCATPCGIFCKNAHTGTVIWRMVVFYEILGDFVNCLDGGKNEKFREINFDDLRKKKW